MSGVTGQGWQPFPGAGGGERPDLPRVEPGRIVGLVAVCDLRTPRAAGARAQDFSVSEAAVLHDGRRVVLHQERGFTIGWGPAGAGAQGELCHPYPADALVRDVLTCVLPDDDDPPEQHPWAWLASLACARGLDVGEQELRRVPYEVELTDAVRDWLARQASGA